MPNLISQLKEKFFIGSNTSEGFVNNTEEIISGIKKVYIIKGGPGTGKSTLMKKIAEEAAGKGFFPKLYYCSSDSSSLDAIVITEASVAIVDGTAPHQLDAKYPGAVEEIINLGEFLDSDELSKNSEQIRNLAERKKELFDSVYRYLSVCREIENEKNKILKRCVNIPKMQAAIARLKKKITGNQNSLILNRQISSLGMNGVTRFDTYESLCSELWLIKDSRHIGGIFLSTLLSELKALCCEIWVSQTPLLEIEAIYLPNCGIAITNSNDERKNSKIINTERFIISKEFSAKRTTLKFLFNLQKELYKKVNELFSEIKKIHFTLEEIYKSAMDFSFSEEISKEILEKIDK